MKPLSLKPLSPKHILFFASLFLLGCDEDVRLGTGDTDGSVTTSDASTSLDDDDNDGLANDIEEDSRVDTLIRSADTDQDGYSDGLELVVDSGDPLNGSIIPLAEARSRSVLSGEVLTSEVDRDQDGLGRNFEIEFDLDDNDEDIDNDGYTDALELVANSDPFLASSVPQRSQPPASDGIEREASDPSDADRDGLADSIESFQGTNSNQFDTDGDGFSDGIEFLMGSSGNDPANIPNFSVPERPTTETTS